ncbi:aspartate kinase [Methanosarcinales archaeon]|nr:MAG: aspartate kinase [Methanosarcinales archaeon]
MRVVMKFGGASVADGEKINRVAHIIRDYNLKGYEMAVVTSALKGITDILIEGARKISTGCVDDVEEVIQKLRERHQKTINEAIKGKYKKEAMEKMESLLEELEKVLMGICYVGEITPRSLDYVSCFGERFASPILSFTLRSIGVPSCSLEGHEAGIITDDRFGDARPLEKTYRLVKERVLPLLKTSVPVIAGFMGATEKGIITTLGRGGSDLTASLVGAGINADEIWLWKETDGIMTTDPKLVPEARTLRQISYLEAMELSYFGAKILHPRAIEPAIHHNIPVRVKNTFNPDFEGTLIVADNKKMEHVVKAISVINNVALINVSGAGMIGTIGVAARVFSALARARVNITMISQGSSEANISVVVREEDADKAYYALKEEFQNNIVKDVDVNRNISVIAVVGAGMSGTPGVAGKVFSAMGREGINIIMISQGSSELNISFVVDEKDAIRAVQALHREFRLHEVQ